MVKEHTLDKLLNKSAENINLLTGGILNLTGKSIEAHLENPSYSKNIAFLKGKTKFLNLALKIGRALSNVYKSHEYRYEETKELISKLSDNIHDVLDSYKINDQVLKNIENHPDVKILYSYFGKLKEIMSNAASIYALITTLPKTSNYIFKYLDNEMRDLEESIKWKIRVLFEKFKKNYNESISYRFISYRDMIEETSSIVNYLIELALLNELKEAVKRGPKGLEKYANILREHYEVLVSGGDPEKMGNVVSDLIKTAKKYLSKEPELKHAVQDFTSELKYISNIDKYVKCDEECSKSIVGEYLKGLKYELHKKEPYIKFLDRIMN
jgi:hypothetical protein